MKILFVTNKRRTDYSQELEAARRLFAESLVIQESDLTLEFLKKNHVDIVISNFLSEEWAYNLKGLGIVSIVIDSISKYPISDIVIDYKAKTSKRYFTGPSYSFLEGNFKSFPKIVNMVEMLPWDSDFFGFPIALITSKYLTQSIYEKIDRFKRHNSVRLFQYLCNCHDKRSVMCAEDNGFRFVDIRDTFEIKMADVKQAVPLRANMSFGLARKRDIKILREMSKDLYRDSRYYFDGDFGLEKTTKFYQGWVEKAVLKSFDDACFCLFINDGPVGFCTVSYSGNRADIGLFGMDKKVQGNGLGTLLMSHFLEAMKLRHVDSVCVVTQGRNYDAQRLYQRSGFVTKSVELWYHKWV